MGTVVGESVCSRVCSVLTTCFTLDASSGRVRAPLDEQDADDFVLEILLNHPVLLSDVKFYRGHEVVEWRSVSNLRCVLMWVSHTLINEAERSACSLRVACTRSIPANNCRHAFCAHDGLFESWGVAVGWNA